MTVAELIEKLREMPEDMEVEVENVRGGYLTKDPVKLVQVTYGKVLLLPEHDWESRHPDDRKGV